MWNFIRKIFVLVTRQEVKMKKRVLIYDDKRYGRVLTKKNGQIHWFFTKIGAWLYLKRNYHPGIKQRYTVSKLKY